MEKKDISFIIKYSSIVIKTRTNILSITKGLNVYILTTPQLPTVAGGGEWDFSTRWCSAIDGVDQEPMVLVDNWDEDPDALAGTISATYWRAQQKCEARTGVNTAKQIPLTISTPEQQAMFFVSTQPWA